MFHLHTCPRTQQVDDSFASFLIMGSLHDAIEIQQNVVARSIESSHEDLHEVTSISLKNDLNSQRVFSKKVCHKDWISAWNSSNNHGTFSSKNFSNDF